MATAHINQSGNLTAIKVFASVSEQSASGNYRTVYLNVWAEPQDGYTGARDADWTFNAVDANNGSINQVSSSATIITSSMSIFSGTITVYVSPGSTSAYPEISFSAEYYSSTAKGYRRVSGSITEISGLSLIADTCISSVKDVYFGDRCLVSWVPASSAFHYKLTFSVGNSSYTTSVISPNSSSMYQYSGFTIPLDWASNIPNNTSTTARVTLTQYENSNGTSVVGTPGSATFTVALKDDVVPSIESCDLYVKNISGTVVDTWGVALAGFSRLNISARANGAHGSVITSYNITGSYVASVSASDNDRSLDYTGGVISTSGNKQFNITCTDSRGRTSDIFQSDVIFVNPYTPPRIKKLSVAKDTNGTNVFGDDSMVITALWEYDPVDVDGDGSSSGYNSVQTELYYREGVDSDWTLYNGNIQNNIPLRLTNLTITESSSYNFKIVITDSIGRRSDKEAFSSARTVLMDFQAGGKGLGIGKICQIDNTEKDAGSLEVSMDSYFWGDMHLTGASVLILGSSMYGSDKPENAIQYPTKGQIYFKKVDN